MDKAKAKKRDIKVHDMVQFENEYPHLVETVPNKRKILAALKQGWPINGVEVIEGDDD